MTEWVEVVDREYLSDFIAAGGGCVKFAVGSAGAAREACDSLESLALGHGFLFIELGARDTRLNRSDQIFFDIAKNIDWDRLAGQYVRAALEKQGWSRAGRRFRALRRAGQALAARGVDAHIGGEGRETVSKDRPPECAVPLPVA